MNRIDKILHELETLRKRMRESTRDLAGTRDPQQRAYIQAYRCQLSEQYNRIYNLA